MAKYRFKYLEYSPGRTTSLDFSHWHLATKEFEAADEEEAKRKAGELWYKMTKIKKLTSNDDKLPREPHLERYQPIELTLRPYHFSPRLNMTDPDPEVFSAK